MTIQIQNRDGVLINFEVHPCETCDSVATRFASSQVPAGMEPPPGLRSFLLRFSNDRFLGGTIQDVTRQNWERGEPDIFRIKNYLR